MSIKPPSTVITSTAMTALSIKQEQPSQMSSTSVSAAKSPSHTDVLHKCKIKYLPKKSEYPMTSLSPRHFTLKRQKRISENQSISTKKRSASMRKSRSLEAEHTYSIASIQSPLWVTLTNARTIEELSRHEQI